MSNKTVVVQSGIGLGGMLTIIFVIAKIMDKLDWGWLWVFSPLWLPTAAVLAIVAALLAFAGVAYGIAAIADSVSRSRRRRARAKKGDQRFGRFG